MSPPALASIMVGSADPQRLRAWYVDVLGARRDRAGHLDVGPVGLLVDRRPLGERNGDPGRLILNFHVPDIAALETALIGHGTIWVREVERTAWGRIGTVLDPDGNYVQIIDETGRRH